MLYLQKKPLLEKPPGFVGELVSALTSAGPDVLRWGTVPMASAPGPLSQVVNLERILRALNRMGAPAVRSSVRGVHPDRYVVEFLHPRTGEIGKVMAPMDAWGELVAELPHAYGHEVSTGSPQMILSMLRILLQQKKPR